MNRRRPALQWLALHVALWQLLATAAAVAADAQLIEGSIATLSGDDWQMSGLKTVVEVSDAGLRGTVHIARLRLLDAEQAFDDLVAECELLQATNRRISCARAAFTATIPGVGRQTLRGAFSYDRVAAVARVKLAGLRIAGGEMHLAITAGNSSVTVQFDGTRLQLAELFELANYYGAGLNGYAAIGRADMRGEVRSIADGGVDLIVHAGFDAVSINNDSGTVASDSLRGNLDADLHYQGGSARFAMTLQSDQGEVYIEPVYANFTEHAARLFADNVTTTDFSRFDIGRFELRQESLLNATGDARVALPDWGDGTIVLHANVELADTAVDTLYASVVQIAVAGTVLGDLETDGCVSGTVTVENNMPTSARLQLHDVAFDDRRGRLAVYGLHGTIDWPGSARDAAGLSQLQWGSGAVYDIAVGGGAAELQLGDDDAELLAPLRVPTMGGALLINQFVLRDFGTATASGVLDAELEPIQLGQLSSAFGWPAFSGTLSGRLPLLQLAGDTVTVGGTLSARAFDGNIEISKLRVERPFGRVPRLQADMRFRDLDLMQLTDTFSFGLIQGRLSGDVTGLTLLNWEPVAMDMHFYTPAGDKSQRRISQRAVENLASVGGGGGAAAVLSSGFLQFFDVFGYEKIGLRCVLRDGVCDMSGAGPAKPGPQGSGYYIVKGSGIPRIDVVGYRSRVSWPRLIRQLATITESGVPTLNQ